MKFFATTTKGLEDVLAAELIALGTRDVIPGNGGVNFSGSFKDGYKACLWLRTANRVLQPIASFPCPSEEALYEGVYALNWDELMTSQMTLAVGAKLRDSEITHSHYAALKTKDARKAIRCQAEAIIETMDQLRQQNNRAASETAIDY